MHLYLLKVGKNVKDVKVGDKVGVGCIVDSCLDCSNCKEVRQLPGLQQLQGGKTAAWTVATAWR
jgi:D-arabinose 1-dehydrogenase-like Zn-dependent alcohol dehydrogenase